MPGKGGRARPHGSVSTSTDLVIGWSDLNSETTDSFSRSNEVKADSNDPNVEMIDPFNRSTDPSTARRTRR